MSEYFEIPVGDPQASCYVCCADSTYFSDNNEEKILRYYCDECENGRAEKFGCAMILKEGCGCLPGGEDCPCGCGGTGTLR